MAPDTSIHGEKARSPSPVAGSRRRTKLGMLLGNFRRLYRHFPELSPGIQDLPSERSSEHHPVRNTNDPKEPTQQPAPIPNKHTISLPRNILEPLPAEPANSAPKLGKLDKLEKLGLVLSASSKTSPTQSNVKTTSQVHGGPKAQLQEPWHIQSYPARLQRAYGLTDRDSNNRDYSSTRIETESQFDADEGSADDSGSKATTPATSPDFTFELQAKIDAIVRKAIARKAATSAISQDTEPSLPTVEVIAPVGLWTGAEPAAIPQGSFPPTFQLPSSLHFAGPLASLVYFLEKAQRYRSNLATRFAAKSAVSQPGETITLPWDENGNYTVGQSVTHQKVGISYGNRSTCIIEPHYRVDKVTQLNIVKARLAQLENNRQSKHASLAAVQVDKPGLVVGPALVDNSIQPIHVFVDMSNIAIGFYNHMRQERDLLPQQRIQASFFFEALAVILERERSCAKRIVAGSMGPGAPWEDHFFEAQDSGYTMHILQRVKGVKPSKIPAQPSPSTLSPNNGGNVHHEQGVDEILQLHMLQSIVDTPSPRSESGEVLSPGTMVLATGDGAEAEFSDGFFKHVLRALKHGWCVELVGFRRNMNQVWHEQAIPTEWRPRFRKIFLDGFAEELLASFH